MGVYLNSKKFAEMVQKEVSLGTVHQLTRESGRMPLMKDDDCIIIELKVNYTAEEAVRQIKDRQYALRFEGKPGESPEYTGRILAVGIAYRKEDENKRHECKVEVLRERLNQKGVYWYE